MKKILLYISVLALGLNMACDPLEETYEELDSQVADPSSIQEVEWTLTEDNYDDLNDQFGVAGFGNFSNDEEAREYIPFILDEAFGHLGDGSAAFVTYELYRGGSDEVWYYLNRDEYMLADDDYTAAGASNFFFNEQVTGEESLPGILATNFPNAEDGMMVAASYEYAPINYEDVNTNFAYSEDFEAESDLSAFTTVNIEGPQEWFLGSSSSGYQYAGMSGFSGGNVPNEDWLVLPSVDLTGFSNASLKINQVLAFLNSAEIGTDISVKISTDYAGDATTATWTDLTFDQWPAGDNFDRYDSEADLSAYADQTVTIAFFYRSTVDFAPNWRIASVSLGEGEEVDTYTRNTFYEYDMDADMWMESDDNVYYLDDEDYDAMGAPGRFNNFSSSVSADDYLPELLNQLYPYAQEEESYSVIYKYFSSSRGEVQTRGDLYTVVDGMWSKYEFAIDKTLQFGKEEGEWVPDNTIRYTLQAGDYSAIAANENLGNAGARANLDQYGNFNVLAGNWTRDDILEAIDFVLKQNYPNAEEGQKFLVSYDTFPTGLQEVAVILEGGNYVEQ